MNLPIDAHQAAFAIVAMVLVVVMLRMFRKWTKDTANSFDIRDLFMENGRASKGAVVLMGAFIATTTQFVYYTFTGKLTEGYFTAYAVAWIAPVVAKLITSSGQYVAPPEVKS